MLLRCCLYVNPASIRLRVCLIEGCISVVDDHCFGGTPNWSARVDCSGVYIVGRSAPEVCVSLCRHILYIFIVRFHDKKGYSEYSVQVCGAICRCFRRLRYWKSASFQLERRRFSFHLEKVWLPQSCVGTDWTISHMDLSWEPKSCRLRDAIWST